MPSSRWFVATWPRAAFILIVMMAASVISTNASRISRIEASVQSRDEILPAQQTADTIGKLSEAVATDQVQTSRLDGIDARIARLIAIIMKLTADTAAMQARIDAANLDARRRPALDPGALN